MTRITPVAAALLAGVAATAAATACATAPRPTAEAVRRSANPRAVVEGRVRDRQGRPVADVVVRGLPREKDLPWSPASVTGADGRFRLTLFAPGDYGFVLEWKGTTVVTARPDDPSRVHVALVPSERQDGIELVFHREEWERAIRAPAPDDRP